MIESSDHELPDEGGPQGTLKNIYDLPLVES